MKVMIVDDNAEMRAMIRSIVAGTGDTVSECSDGSMVISTFERAHPDVVLMDLHMKQVNGIEATRNLKNKYPDATVIIVSNFNDQDFRDAAQDAGAASYFTKDNLISLKQFIHQ